MLEIFKVFGEIAIDHSKADQAIEKTSSNARKIGESFEKSVSTSGRSLAEIAAANGKTVNEIKSEVAKIAAEYRKNGMDASAAMKQAYADIGYVAKETHDSIDKEIGETVQQTEKMERSVSSSFEKIGNKAVAIGKTIATGLAVGTAAITALTVGAMNKAGELEQNMGGSAQVFKEHAQGMQETAKTAYKNMGLSASSFLATANKMGALFQGVGFDIKESADISAEAMQRAADVASIMGVDLEWAMESIAGAAKGNFTMMDNLGVAINDTTLNMYALEKGINKTTQQMTTQEKVALAMELFMERTAYATGNYAKENDTLAGSLSTAKAALDNFLSGAGDAEALADAFVGTAEVIILKLDSLLPSLVTGIGQLVKKLAPKIPGLLTRLLPNVVEAMGGIIGALVPKIPGMIVELAPVLIDAAKDLGRAMIDAIAETIPALEQMFEDFGIRLQDLLIIIGGVVLAFKGFSIVNGVVSAITTLTTAFSGLSAIMAAHPIGALVTALGLLLATLGAVGAATREAIGPAYELSDAEKAVRDKADEAREAHEKLKDSFADKAVEVDAEAKRIQVLWSELQTLADENGNVEEASRERANFILGELSEAMGQEYEMVDNQILGYQELISTIDELIKKKQAESLMTSFGANYDQANADQLAASNAAAIAYEALQAENDRIAEQERKIAEVQEILDTKPHEFYESRPYEFYVDDLNRLTLELEQFQIKQVEAEKTYQEAQATALSHFDTVTRYEEAQVAVMAGNYDEAIQILTNDVMAHWRHYNDLAAISEEELALLKANRDETQRHYNWLLEQIEAGIIDADASIVKIVKSSLDELNLMYNNAASASEAAGKEIGNGLTNGLNETASTFVYRAQSVMRNAIGAMKEVAQIASPSKVTAEFGRYLVEGLSEGISDSEHMAEVAASDAMRKTTDSFAAGMTTSGSGVEVAELGRKLEDLTRNLPDMMAASMVEAIAGVGLKINNREFGRLVRGVT